MNRYRYALPPIMVILAVFILFFVVHSSNMESIENEKYTKQVTEQTN